MPFVFPELQNVSSNLTRSERGAVGWETMSGSQLQPPPRNESLEPASSPPDFLGVTWPLGRNKKETLNFEELLENSSLLGAFRTETGLLLGDLWENETLSDDSAVSNETWLDVSVVLSETLYNVSTSVNETLHASVNSSQECEVNR